MAIRLYASSQVAALVTVVIGGDHATFRVKDLNLNYLSQSQVSCQLDELGL